jgi:hypothetical protein
MLQAQQNSRTKNGTRPVTGKGQGKVRRQKDWQDTTIRDGISYGKKAWQLAKHLATLINVEDKKFDVDGSTATVISSTASVYNLSNIAQGNDYNNRSGDSILAQGMELRIAVGGSSVNNGSYLRVLLVADRENHGADIAIGDVLQGGAVPFLQPINATSGNRFEVLYDEVVFMSALSPALASSGTSTAYIPDRLLLPVLNRKWNKHIKYTSSAGADASNWENALFLVAISSDATNGPTISFTFRLHFTDN